MKDHVRISKEISVDGDVDNLLIKLQDAKEEMINPSISLRTDGQDIGHLVISGWRITTQAELEEARKRRERDRKASLEQREKNKQIRLELWRNLKKEFKDGNPGTAEEDTRP